MKKNIIAALAAILFSCAALPAQSQGTYMGSDPMGTLSYALPSTVITLEVEAVQESFHAGPYAKYAKKYLGVDARQTDEVKVHLTSVKLTPSIEADQTRRFQITPGKGSTSFLSLSSQGLISIGDALGSGTTWRFATATEGDFSSLGVSSNLTSESTTLYRKSAGESSFKVAVQQEMVVEKTPDARAKEAAEMIVNLRKKRIQIATGDTDATFSGEALGAALAEIETLEKEYLSMFLGYSEYQTQSMNYDVVPDASSQKQVYIAFRVSDTAGLVPADNMSGKPYILQLEPQDMDSAFGKATAVKSNVAVYRIPAICTAKLTDGAEVLIQTRIPVYQLGIESTFTIY